MIASLPSAFAAFFLEVVLMEVGTVLGVVRPAARIPGGSTALRKGMPRRVVALIRGGGDVTKYWHWRALHTLGFVCVEDMSISHKSIKMAIFAVFALCDYKREKRGRATESVISLKALSCLSYDCYFISRFFLVNKDPYGKLKNSLYGSSEISHKLNFIHLDPTQ